MTDAIRLSKLAAISAFAAIAVTACGPDRPGEGPRTEVTRDQIEEGLGALGMAEESRMEWDSSVIDGGVAVFTGVTRPDSELPGRIGRFSIAAPRVEGGVTRFDALEAEDLTVEDEDQITRLERLKVDQPGPGLSQWLSDVMAGRMNEGGYEPPSRSAADYTFSEVSMSGMTIAPRDNGAAPTGRIARMALEDFDGQKLGRAVIEGMAFRDAGEAGEAFMFALEEFSMTGMDALFAEIFLNLDDETGFPALGDAFGDAMSAWMRPTGAFDAMRVRGLELAAGGASIDMPSMDMRYETRRDDSIDIIAEMPSLRIALSPDAPEMAEASQMLAMMGYEVLEFAAYSRTRFDPQADRATTTLDDYWFELTDGLRISLAQDVTGLQAYSDATAALMSEMIILAEEDPAQLDAADERLLEAYGHLKVNAMTIRIEDRDLVSRLIAMNAQMQGVSPEEARMQAATMVSLGIAMAGGMLPDGLALQLGGAISALISEGGAVELVMNPDEPVGMDLFFKLDEDMSVLSDLGLSVRHIPPQ
ncbi:hypothetical protein F1654_09540 [Alkalicaulis satelles]|uniref:DUF945 domain-containing protein n=1 Tax=Alkalicaulis satelles TaxID=2609175 RepID=A0A5M6ZGW8_9PROT|nr:hypothetical protein [Alkalicaulis satelles]KAA5804016.1 hypothetical protein F1654_09540 [Alkalicaulis satelles]